MLKFEDGKWTADEVKGILCNPVYVGIGPYPAIIDRASWIKAGVKFMAEVGPEKYLDMMLTELKSALAGTMLMPDVELVNEPKED